MEENPHQQLFNTLLNPDKSFFSPHKAPSQSAYLDQLIVSGSFISLQFFLSKTVKKFKILYVKVCLSETLFIQATAD